MEWASADVIRVITYLLPGFLAAWVFYGLTAHKRQSPFERVIQALIFLAFIQAITGSVQALCLFIGRQFHSFGAWTPGVSAGLALALAAPLGLAFAWCANKNWLHEKLLYRFDITTRTSYPSEWYAALNNQKRYVILHLKDGRRIHGWPFEFPDHSDCGHFVLMQAQWLLDDNSCAPLYNVERFILPVSDVAWVEMMKDEREVSASSDEIEAVEKLLVGLQSKGNTNEQQTPAAAASKADAAALSFDRRERHDRPAAGRGQSPAVATPTPSKDRKVKHNGRKA